jgi:hypothetical protein
LNIRFITGAFGALAIAAGATGAEVIGARVIGAYVIGAIVVGTSRQSQWLFTTRLQIHQYDAAPYGSMKLLAKPEPSELDPSKLET